MRSVAKATMNIFLPDKEVTATKEQDPDSRAAARGAANVRLNLRIVRSCV